MRKLSLFICVMMVVALAANIQHAENRITVYLKNDMPHVYDPGDMQAMGFSQFDNNLENAGRIVSNYFAINRDSVDYHLLADIDSVVFGSPESIRLKPDVTEISDEAHACIMDYDPGTGTIHYRKTTPAGYIPKAGDKIVYPKISEIFTYGLCARVKDVTADGETIAVRCDELAPGELYDEFTVSSSIFAEDNQVEINSGNEVEIPDDEDDEEGISDMREVRKRATVFDGQSSYHYKAKVNLSTSKVRYNAVTGDVYAKLTLSIDCNYNIDFLSEIQRRATYATGDSIHIPIAISNLTKQKSWFRPLLDMMLKFKVNARSVDIDMNGHHNYNVSIYYMAADGDTASYAFFSPEITSNAESEITFNNDSYIHGSVSLLANYILNIRPIFQKTGVRALFSTGPSVKGTIGADSLDLMSWKYLENPYKKSNIDISTIYSLTGFAMKYSGNEITSVVPMKNFGLKKMVRSLPDAKLFMFPQFSKLSLDREDKLIFRASSASKLVRDVSVGAEVFMDSIVYDTKTDVAQFVHGANTLQSMEAKFTRKPEYNLSDTVPKVRPVISYAGRQILGPDKISDPCDFKDAKHPHAIDLGLPSGTKWCCMNVGAKEPSGGGGYYLGNQMTQAVKSLGEGYSVPTLAQINELVQHTVQVWSEVNGVNGIMFIGNNGNRIFLPAVAQLWEYEGVWEINNEGSGAYWTVTPSIGAQDYNYFMEFNHEAEDIVVIGDRDRRGNKLPVRAVYMEVKKK